MPDYPDRLSIEIPGRVKDVDIHPTEPWVLASLYTGEVHIYDIKETAAGQAGRRKPKKLFKVSDGPVRTSKFIARKNWIITGSDEGMICVFNYNTSEKVRELEGHPDYIRRLIVHPTLPIVLSGSDDRTIRLWDFDQDWKNIRTFEGHSHFVMDLAFNPKDPNTFASASLDFTVKVWSLNSDVANYTLEGHTEGVNSVDYYHGPDKNYLISAGDDKAVKIWDLQNRNCVQTLEGHTKNINFAIFHPDAPVILSGSEDQCLCVWNSNTYRRENRMNYGLDRAWCVAYGKEKRHVAIGYDEGIVVIQLGNEEPPISMGSSGKLIWAEKSTYQTGRVTVDDQVKDGVPISFRKKEFGIFEFHPDSLKHSPDGQSVAVCGAKQYNVCTTVALNVKASGVGLDFAWAQELKGSKYAVLESEKRIKIFENYKEVPDVLPKFNNVSKIFGGTFLGVQSQGNLAFYNWKTGYLVRRLEGDFKKVYWSDDGTLVTVVGSNSFVLSFDEEAYEAFVQNEGRPGDEGVEDAFDVKFEIIGTITSGLWVRDCFIYTDSTKQLKYLIGEQPQTISHSDKELFLLGFKDSRVFLSDKTFQIYSYILHLAVIDFQTLIARGEFSAAKEILPEIPNEQRAKIAAFLEAQSENECKALALEITNDSAQKFTLGLELDRIDIATDAARELNQAPLWKKLGDKALASWKFTLAEECFQKANDLESLLLFYTASGNNEGIKDVAEKAVAARKNNVAFNAFFQIGAVEKATDLMVKAGRIPEAALLARTYAPDQVSRIVTLWKTQLENNDKKKVADSLADPSKDASKFPELSKKVESLL